MLRSISVYRHAVVITPVARWALIARGTAYSNRFPVPSGCGLPHLSARSASTLVVSRPAQRSLAITACRLAASPKRHVCLEGSDGFVSSTRRFDSYRLERPRCRVGFAPTEDRTPLHGARRVEMWRGVDRLGISGSGPFGCRCLTSFAVDPFSHPAHQTGSVEQNAHLVTPGQIAVRPCLSSGCRRCSDWWSGIRSAGGELSKEGCHAPISNHRRPPPRRGKVNSHPNSQQLWVTFPVELRERILTRTDPCRRPATGEASRRQGGDA